MTGECSVEYTLSGKSFSSLVIFLYIYLVITTLTLVLQACSCTGRAGHRAGACIMHDACIVQCWLRSAGSRASGQYGYGVAVMHAICNRPCQSKRTLNNLPNQRLKIGLGPGATEAVVGMQHMYCSI